MDIQCFWKDVLRQDRAALREYFTPDAVIRWHCSNEQFTVEEYIRADRKSTRLNSSHLSSGTGRSKERSRTGIWWSPL